MKLDDLESVILEMMPFHTKILEPVYKRIRVPIQSSFKGFESYPSASTKTRTMGNFYEGLNKGIFGGKLNDNKFDIEFVNGNVSERTIKPDIIDAVNKIHWESKATYFQSECEIMKRQLEGYRFLQYDNPETTFLFSIYRHSLPGIKKQDRTEEEVVKGLMKSTKFSIVLPLSVILSLEKNPVSGDIALARNYSSKKSNWPDCLCINHHTMNRFLINPAENLELLGFDSDRFEIERYSFPEIITINRKKVKPFPIVKIVDKGYFEWVKKFMAEFESERYSNETCELDSVPLFEDSGDVPF
jgi:hypothetical protein